MSLRLLCCSRSEAHDFINRHHRHHDAPPGEVFRVAVVDEGGTVHGVALAGRPVARMLDDGRTLEVTRVAVDGTRNACSFLYGALRRAAWALGYGRIFTYTLPSEGGASLRAAGWTLDAQTKERPSGWNCTSRPREVKHTEAKQRWISMNPKAPPIAVWPVAEPLPPGPLFASVTP